MQKVRNLISTEEKLTIKLKRYPTKEEIMEELNISLDELKVLNNSIRKIEYLEENLNRREDKYLKDNISYDEISVEDYVIDKISKEEIELEIAKIKEEFKGTQRKEIANHLFDLNNGEYLRTKEIAKNLNVRVQCVSSTKKQIVKKLNKKGYFN